MIPTEMTLPGVHLSYAVEMTALVAGRADGGCGRVSALAGSAGCAIGGRGGGAAALDSRVGMMSRLRDRWPVG
jgi:hypothetical protein